MAATLSNEAYQQIISMIFDGRLRAGDALQEHKLAVGLGMSRTPVSEAIKRIEAEGLAEQQGRLTRVRLPSADEIAEVFFLRLQIEPPAARTSIGIPKAELDLLAQRIEAIMAAGPDQGGDAHWRLDDEFHGMIVDSTGNATAGRVLADLRRRTCMFDAERVPQRFVQGCEEHLSVLAALRSGDPDAAEQAMVRHIENARDAILERLDSMEASAIHR